MEGFGSAGGAMTIEQIAEELRERWQPLELENGVSVWKRTTSQWVVAQGRHGGTRVRGRLRAARMARCLADGGTWAEALTL